MSPRIHTDYLGSLTSLTDASGNAYIRYSFDAWGQRRNSTDWKSADTRTNLKFNRGFTGHSLSRTCFGKHIDGFGLINMNGRVYDPFTACFLSPDPYVQAPGQWLNYNRYSYGLNNPMMYTDPSGESFLPFLFVAIGAYVGDAAANDWKFNPFKWKYNFSTFGSMLLGGITGALGGQSMAGFFKGSTPLSVGVNANNVITSFANFSLKEGKFLLKGAGYVTAAGGGAYLTKSAIDNMMGHNKQDSRVVVSNPVERDYGTISQKKLSWADKWSEKENFFGRTSYNIVDNLWVGIQTPFLGPDSRHLNGSVVTGNDRVDAFVGNVNLGLTIYVGPSYLKNISGNSKGFIVGNRIGNKVMYLDRGYVTRNGYRYSIKYNKKIKGKDHWYHLFDWIKW